MSRRDTLKLLVAGTLNPPSHDPEALAAFGSALAFEVISSGHTLMGGCMNAFDTVVAETAHRALVRQGAAPAADGQPRLRSFVLGGQQPAHAYGSVVRSRLNNWQLDKDALLVPEQVAQADAVVLCGGGDGTLVAANWARIAGKPLLPLAAFGGAAERLYLRELDAFAHPYIPASRFEVLGRLAAQPASLAADVVQLAEALALPREVAVLMSYADDAGLQATFDTVCRTCHGLGYRADRVDHGNTLGRIVPAIMHRIEHCAFVVCDLTGLRPNVFYELGYAAGLHKRVVQIAREGTVLPFDLHDHPTLFYRDAASLARGLAERIALVMQRH
jgi:hypothetical protein